METVAGRGVLFGDEWDTLYLIDVIHHKRDIH